MPKLVVRNEVYNQRGELLADGSVTLGFIDAETRHPVRCPEKLAAVIRASMETDQIKRLIMIQPMVFGLGGWEILIIALVILLIFGGAKIPELMKGLGKGVRNFKEGIKEGDNEAVQDDASHRITDKKEDK